jgi:GT2 family glycosyltransferase/membrane protein implicated in regulation of membrane protease activity
MKTHKTTATSQNSGRVQVKGKFLYAGTEKFYVKGVTYGTFAPDENRMQFPPRETVEKDFALMAAHGFNAVRTYTVPPSYLLDLAFHYGLKVMVGLPWEQHITFLDSRKQQADILRRIREGVQSCEQHPAILCFTVGNEIPAPIVRWYGKEKIESWIKRLYKTVKEVDPGSLVTYVNYPTTEYLDLSFLDFDCFNVYLETPEKLSAYISRLHNLSGDRPLVLAEIGLDSLRNGHDKQAEVLTWQIETIYGKGCAGMFVFAWTDEWWRGGFRIEDWDFGLVDRQRQAKPALQAVETAMRHLPCRLDKWPFISVAVCSYNGSATIRDTMEALQRLDYPNFEVVVVNDGSTDNFAQIVKEYPVRLISTPNQGLSNARNTAAQYAKGEIIAFIDDDAYPDPHWLHYLAYAYENSNHAGIGGPNIAPEEDGPVAHCVANAPGGPVHVLTTDEIAEHIPGCNMSFRREVYLKVGGCDPIYRAAGDDVDLCWRIQDAGYTIGFHPAALVWHHRRNSLKAYWKQQKGYGKAESLLESKWPQKYNGFGHLAWAGRIYGNGWTMPLKSKRPKVFHGTWGTALFQSLYQPGDGLINCLPLMPEWYLIAGLLGFIACLGLLWVPLLWVFIPFAVSVLVIVAQAVYSAVKNAHLPQKYRRPKYQLLVVALHIVQPAARLYGRIKFGLTPWRKRGAGWSWKYLPVLRNKLFLHWSEKWHSTEDYLQSLEQSLINQQMVAQRGGDFDRWDLQTGNKLFAHVRCLLTVEEHGAGKQYVKIKSTVSFAAFSLSVLLITGVLAGLALWEQEWIVGSVFAAFFLTILVKCTIEKSNVLHSLEVAIAGLPKHEVVPPMVIVHMKDRQEEIITNTASSKKGKLLKLKLEEETCSDKPKSLSEVHGL